MNYLLALLFLLISITTMASESVDARASRAKEVENTPVGKAYQHDLWQAIGAETATLMQECFPQQSEPDTRSFIFVANVLPNGTSSDAVVHPSTPMAQCFSSGFSRLHLPIPSDTFGKSGMPLAIEMTVAE